MQVILPQHHHPPLQVPPPELAHHGLQEVKRSLLDLPGAELVFEHTGKIVAGMIPSLLEKMEAHCHHCGDPVAVRKRLVQVVMESVDNLGRHALDIPEVHSVVLVGRDAAGYLVATGNAVPATTAVLLSHRMEILNMMEQEDLREHYLKLLANKGRSANGGAGLGLLTMARKVVRPMISRSVSLGPFTAYFTIEMRVGLHTDQPGPAAA